MLDRKKIRKQHAKHVKTVEAKNGTRKRNDDKKKLSLSSRIAERSLNASSLEENSRKC